MRIGYLAIDRPPSCSLVELLLPFAPALQLDTAGHGAWFDAGGVRLRDGDEERYGRAILAAVAAAGGAGRVGVAATPWVARVAARVAESGETVAVPAHETRAFLGPLPLEWLPLPRRVLARLRALGIVTIGRFAELPPADVRRRFGPEAALAHRLARGDDPTPFRGEASSEPLRFQRTLEPPAVTDEALAAALDALCERASHELARHGHVAWRLRLEFVDEEGRVDACARRFPRPRRTASELLEATQDLAARAALARPVALVRLVVEEHRPARAWQPSLLGETTAVREGERERLRSLLERHAPGRIVRVVEHRPAAPLPEFRWRIAERTDEHPLAGEPVQLRRHTSGCWLDYAGRRVRIVRGGCWERIDLCWPEARHRRVFWVELADGQRLLLAWETSDRTWRLVGRID
ncbi:MAG: hypothetical protein RMK01_12910 [Thermomicrobium sp.]|nr:hypothetical protein [Thermomicrobium sp.]